MAVTSSPQSAVQLVSNAMTTHNELSKEALGGLPCKPSQLDVWAKNSEISQTPISIMARQFSSAQVGERCNLEELAAALRGLEEASMSNHGEVFPNDSPLASSLPSGLQYPSPKWSPHGLELGADEALNESIAMVFEINADDQLYSTDTELLGGLPGQNLASDGEPGLIDESFRGIFEIDASHSSTMNHNSSLTLSLHNLEVAPINTNTNSAGHTGSEGASSEL
ncbi:hypothetical protein BGZ60DRAFT_413384 [Tricladium varicosporioides]|nr:hypothetical protein BGZ60DRAFT_413384 [Hymenoscyphus varicosporioides]